jgi:signal recognition particle GTPase
MEIQDVNRLLKQHQQMEKMMKKLATPSGITKMIRGMKGLQLKPIPADTIKPVSLPSSDTLPEDKLSLN